MRLLLVFIFLLAAIPAFSQERPFRAIQNGQPVTVICAGTPVFFEDNSSNQNAQYTTFYDPGPDAFDPQNFNQSDLVSRGADGRFQYTYTEPGTYIITQIINRGTGEPAIIEPLEFEVKAAPEPDFSVTACASRSVRVTIADVGYDLYDITYSDNTVIRDLQAGEQATYTFGGSAPTGTVTVTGRYTGGGACAPPSSQTITLLPRPPVPLIARLEVIREAANGEISLSLQNLQPAYRYVVERRDPATGNYQPLHTTAPVTQNTLSDYRVSDVPTNVATLYRVRPTDDCGSRLEIQSASLGSLVLGLQTGNEQAVLNWTGMANSAQRFQVYRDGALLRELNQSTFTYTDSQLSCGRTYCYQVAGIANSGQSTSLSARTCLEATSTATPPGGYLYSTYNERNQVQLMLALPNGQEAQQILFQRSIDGEPFANLATKPETQHEDRLQPLSPVCYRTRYTNLCERTSELSNTTCPVYLIALPQENAPVLTLGWTGYVGFPDGVGSYTVEVLDENGRIISSYPASGNTFIDRNLNQEVQNLLYRIKVTSGNGSAVSYSNTVTVEQPLQLHIPTAFTPNGDGLNDVLEVKGRFIQDFSIRIYNSMGHLVFSSNDRSTSWDGTFQGKPLPAGAYAYDVNVTTTGGEKKQRRGTVTLLR